MADNVISGMVSIALAIVGVAIIAVLVSRNAATAQVVGSLGDAFSRAIGAATGPVSGGAGFGYSAPRSW